MGIIKPMQPVRIIIPEFTALQPKKMRLTPGNIVARPFINRQIDARIRNSKLTPKESHYVDVRP
jgi:hypothetical protein